MMFLTLLADLNLAVWYGIAICTCARKKKLADFNLAVERHTAKFNSPPNFRAIRYYIRARGRPTLVLKTLHLMHTKINTLLLLYFPLSKLARKCVEGSGGRQIIPTKRF